MTRSKEILRAQALLWGQLREKVEKQKDKTGMTVGSIIKTALEHYYSKVNTDYNE